MKTFFESLNITKNTRILEKLVLDLEYAGINSNEFIDWYIAEGLDLQKNNILTEGFNDWVRTEGILDNIYNRFTGGKSSGQKQDYSRSPVVQGIKGTGQKVGQFVQNQGNRVGQAMGWARDAYSGFNQGLQGDTGNNDGQRTFPFMGNNLSNAPAPSVVKSTRDALANLSKRIQYSKELQDALNDPGFGQSVLDLTAELNSIKESYLLKSKLFVLKSNGLDVENLVEWFAEEAIKFDEGIGDWFSKAGNWIKDQWGNAKKTWNTWGEKGNVDETKKRDKQAVDNAMKALEALKQKHGSNISANFSSLLDTVFNKLNSVNNPSREPSQAEINSKTRTSEGFSNR